MAQVTLSECCDRVAGLVQAGQFDRAIAILQHVLLQYPRYVTGYQLLGRSLLEAGSYEEAALEFRRVLSADPENVPAWLGLSRAYQAAGELGQAVEHLQRAWELAPGDADLRQQLDGMIHT
jgi:tetratricopeptide (TPR) repeat protein